LYLVRADGELLTQLCFELKEAQRVQGAIRGFSSADQLRPDTFFPAVAVPMAESLQKLNH
jgi:hypothetical protein